MTNLHSLRFKSAFALINTYTIDNKGRITQTNLLLISFVKLFYQSPCKSCNVNNLSEYWRGTRK